MVDDWTNVPEGIEHDVPVVVEVTVEGNFVKCPSHYVLVSLDGDNCEGNDRHSKFYVFAKPRVVCVMQFVRAKTV